MTNFVILTINIHKCTNFLSMSLECYKNQNNQNKVNLELLTKDFYDVIMYCNPHFHSYSVKPPARNGLP